MAKERIDKTKGDPHINFAMSILLDAKRDAQMWMDYVEEFGEPDRNITGQLLLDTASWVIDWIKQHKKQRKGMGISKDKVNKLGGKGK